MMTPNLDGKCTRISRGNKSDPRYQVQMRVNIRQLAFVDDDIELIFARVRDVFELKWN